MASDKATQSASANGSTDKKGKKAPKVEASATKPRRKMKKVVAPLAPYWDPEAVGEVLAGFYIEAKEIKPHGRAFLTHIIQSEETGEVLSVSGAVADSQFADIPYGSYVEVEFVGYKASKFGNEMKLFEVSVEETVQLKPRAPAVVDDDTDNDESYLGSDAS